MIRAFGFCNDTFDTHSPGRLCRGRERWIEGLPDTSPTRLARTVCSGAVFSDDSAVRKDAAPVIAGEEGEVSPEGAQGGRD